MKESMSQFQLSAKNFLKVSYYTRISSALWHFGCTENEEPNIAYSLLQSLKNVEGDCLKKVMKNIILSGGSFQVPGMAQRLVSLI